jgi:hypothetical protein
VFPRLFSLSGQSEASISDLTEVTGDKIGWSFWWRQRLFSWEEDLVSRLQDILRGVRLLVEPDEWWSKPRVFSLLNLLTPFSLKI